LELGGQRSEVRGKRSGIRENKRRRVMAESLMNLLSGKREVPDIKPYNLKGWRI
jgi:hypothetical protein